MTEDTAVSGPVEFNHVQLEKIRFGLEMRVPEYLNDPTMEVDPYIDRVLIRLRGFVWGEEEKQGQISYPRDWWQAFKERWFPKWMKERWPIVYCYHHLSVKTLYPNFRPSLPNEPSWSYVASEFSIGAKADK